MKRVVAFLKSIWRYVVDFVVSDFNSRKKP